MKRAMLGAIAALAVAHGAPGLGRGFEGIVELGHVFGVARRGALIETPNHRVLIDAEAHPSSHRSSCSVLGNKESRPSEPLKGLLRHTRLQADLRLPEIDFCSSLNTRHFEAHAGLPLLTHFRHGS